MKGRVEKLRERHGHRSPLSLVAYIFLFIFSASSVDRAVAENNRPNVFRDENAAEQPFDQEALDRKIDLLRKVPTAFPYGSERHRQFLINRYGFSEKELNFTEPFPLVLREGMQDHVPVKNPDKPVVEIEKFDAVIIGSGPAGSTAGVFLTSQGKRVLVLEKNRDLGGLAATGNRTGVQYARGGAYFASAEGELLEIYKAIGIGDYEERFPIPEPIDSYDINGRIFEEVWSDKTIAKLPPTFAMLRYALKRMEDDNRVPDQPFEDFPWIEETDSITMGTWVRRIPKMMEYWAKDDPAAAAIVDRFNTETGFDPADPMKGPLGLLDLYGRSALGEHPTEVNAAAYINFYLNELETRYTGNRGAGEVSWAAYQTLLSRRNLAKFKTGAKVVKIENIWAPGNTSKEPDYVEVTYESDGVVYKVRAKDAVFSAPLRLANKAIVDYEKLAPEHHKLTTELEYRDYMVINVHVAGHPWTGAYDLWVRNDGTYDSKSITDIIDGRWMDFKGREGRRTDDRGILTIYYPLDKETSRGRQGKEQAMKIATSGIQQMLGFINPKLKEAGKPEITVLAAEVNYWEDAIHVARPGHFKRAKVLKERVGRIHFANNNIGTPSIEEALYRGKHVADEIEELETCEGPLMKAAN